MKIRLLRRKIIEFSDLRFMFLIRHFSLVTLALENGKTDATKASISVIPRTMQAT
jgi:hypothetical protein